MGDEHEPETVEELLDGVDGVLAPVGAAAGRHPDLAVVDALARLHLAAKHLGWSLLVRNPPTELRELLDLVGLGELIGGPPALRLEAVRKAEDGEQLGVEEAVETGDPAA